MADRIRLHSADDARLADRENALRNVKSMHVAKPIAKRTAFGDVGNNIPQKLEARKPVKATLSTNAGPVKCTKIVAKPLKTVVRQESLFKQDVLTKSPYQIKNQCPFHVPEYQFEIFAYLRELEDAAPIKEKYLDGHKAKPNMRSILVNWLSDVHQNFKLSIETLYLCVAILDRYLQINKNVGKETLQLVGVSALLVACKYEEMYLPELSDFTFVCDNTFTKHQILAMEKDILKKLEFNLGRPLSIQFLRHYNTLAQVMGEQHKLGKYILELVLLEYSLCHVKPSIVAAATCCLAIAVSLDRVELGKVWTPTMVEGTTYALADFKDVMYDIAYIVLKAEGSKYQSVFMKYASSKYGKISMQLYLKGTLLKRLAAKAALAKK